MEGQAAQFGADGERLAFYRRGAGLGIWRFSPAAAYRVLRPNGGRKGEGAKSDLSADGRWFAMIEPSMAWMEPAVLRIWDLNAADASRALTITNLFDVFWHGTDPLLILVTSGGIETRAVLPARVESSGAPELGPPTRLNVPLKAIPLMGAIGGDGHTLVVADGDGHLLIGDPARTNRFVQVAETANSSGPGGSGSLTGSGRLAVSPDGRWVATLDMAATPAPHIFDAATGKLVKVLPSTTAPGRWLATCPRSEVALWSVGSWSSVWRRPRPGSPAWEGCVAFSGDSSVVAFTKALHTVGLVDRVTGRELAELTLPEPALANGIRISTDGSRLVVPTFDGAAQVWDLAVLRRELAAMGLDWGQSAEAKMASQPPPRRGHWAAPTGAILFGLVCVTPAAFFALWSLRRHRRLLQQFVQSEAEARYRIRELEVAKVELMHSQKMKALGTLAAGIAHDFNNLLSVIRMSNKLIGRATKNRAEVAEEVANIEEAVQQGKQVVSSMLGYSRVRSGEDGHCNLDEVVEETVSLLSREFLSGIELTLALDRDAPSVRVGRGRIEQILLNLIVNASEAMKGQGKLEIAVHQARGQAPGGYVLRPQGPAARVELCVTDSGPGIAPEILPRIFEPFFTTKTTGTKQGAGLGLSMVYTIAEQDGLGIAVESSPAGGASFRVLLPACWPESESELPSPNET
jgi:signal transduction histidine kinase